jgi:hypothetical protein
MYLINDGITDDVTSLSQKHTINAFLGRQGMSVFIYTSSQVLTEAYLQQIKSVSPSTITAAMRLVSKMPAFVRTAKC